MDPIMYFETLMFQDAPFPNAKVFITTSIKSAVEERWSRSLRKDKIVITSATINGVEWVTVLDEIQLVEVIVVTSARQAVEGDYAVTFLLGED